MFFHYTIRILFCERNILHINHYNLNDRLYSRSSKQGSILTLFVLQYQKYFFSGCKKKKGESQIRRSDEFDNSNYLHYIMLIGHQFK